MLHGDFLFDTHLFPAKKCDIMDYLWFFPQTLDAPMHSTKHCAVLSCADCAGIAHEGVPPLACVIDVIHLDQKVE
jgi:hypothetical protein